MHYAYIHMLTIFKQTVAVVKTLYRNLHCLVTFILTQIPVIPTTIVCNLHAPTNDGEQVAVCCCLQTCNFCFDELSIALVYQVSLLEDPP